MYIFTIIIPIYNVKKYLNQCIDSVLNQNYKHLEIILIDDGSTDGSDEVCDLYKKKDSRIKVIHQNNGGPSKSRNSGLNIATGKYVMFLDSDDYLANNNVILDFCNIFQKYNCDIIYGVYKGFIDEHYKSCTYQIYPKILNIDNTQLENLSTEEVIQLLFDNGNYYSSPTIKIYKRELIESNGFRFKLNVYHEDEEWTPKILLNSKEIYLYSKEFYMRRYRENSIMTTTNDVKLFKRIIDMLKIAEDMTIYTKLNCNSKELIRTFSEYYKTIIKSYMDLCNEINDAAIKSKAKSSMENSIF